MKQRTLIAAIGFAAASTALLSACSTGTATNSGSTNGSGGTGITIGGIAPNASDPFWITLTCGATKEAEAQGAVMTWKSAADTSTQTLAANLDAVALAKPDGVIVSGSGDGTYNAKISQIQSGGTPVVAVNGTTAPAIAYADIMSDTDNSEFATYVSEHVEGEGSFGILAGIAGFKVLEDRYKPVIDALEKSAPQLKVLEPQYDDFDRTKAATAASAMIVANPDLKAIYAVSGPEGAGAAAAVEQAGKTGEIAIYTYDATPEVVQGLQNGTITAALAQAAYQMGADSVTAILDQISAGKPGAAVERDESKNELIPLKVLTKDNLSDEDSKSYIYSQTCE
jgi:ABC-type sugar transport system substrate-binding protein